MLMRAATVVQVLQDLFYVLLHVLFTCDRSLSEVVTRQTSHSRPSSGPDVSMSKVKIVVNCIQNCIVLPYIRFPMCICVGDGEAGRARAPPPKIRGKYFSGNYYVKFGHFLAKIM